MTCKRCGSPLPADEAGCESCGFHDRSLHRSVVTLPSFGRRERRKTSGRGCKTPPPLSGESLAEGRFDLLDRIAIGPRGELYKAHDNRHDRLVALKLLEHELVSDIHAQAELEDYLTRLSEASHPALVPILEAGRYAGRAFVVTPLLEGISLRRHIELRKLQRKPFTVRELVAIFEPVVEALTLLSHHKLYHGALRPENIVLTTAGPRVTDAWLVGGLQRGIRATRFGHHELIHTAPEIGGGQSPSEASDVFALAMILIELLAERTPRPGATPASLITDIEPRLDALLRRATRARPRERYPTLRKFFDAFSALDPEPRGVVTSARLLDIGERITRDRPRGVGGDTLSGYPGSDLEESPAKRRRARQVTAPGLPTSEASGEALPVRSPDVTRPDADDITAPGLPPSATRVSEEPRPAPDRPYQLEPLDIPRETPTSGDADAAGDARPEERPMTRPDDTLLDPPEAAPIAANSDAEEVLPPHRDPARYVMLAMALVLGVAAVWMML